MLARRVRAAVDYDGIAEENDEMFNLTLGGRRFLQFFLVCVAIGGAVSLLTKTFVSGAGPTVGLSDRRGECIYAACTHYRKCFIEKAVRKARRADIVVKSATKPVRRAGRAFKKGTRTIRRTIRKISPF